MKTNKLLIAAVLAIAIGAPIAGILQGMKGQSVISSGVRVPFLHGFPIGQIAGQTELASLERANEWLNSSPLMPSALLVRTENFASPGGAASDAPPYI